MDLPSKKKARHVWQNIQYNKASDNSCRIATIMQNSFPVPPYELSRLTLFFNLPCPFQLFFFLPFYPPSQYFTISRAIPAKPSFEPLPLLGILRFTSQSTAVAAAIVLDGTRHAGIGRTNALALRLGTLANLVALERLGEHFGRSRPRDQTSLSHKVSRNRRRRDHQHHQSKHGQTANTRKESHTESLDAKKSWVERAIPKNRFGEIVSVSKEEGATKRKKPFGCDGWMAFPRKTVRRSLDLHNATKRDLQDHCLKNKDLLEWLSNMYPRRHMSLSRLSRPFCTAAIPQKRPLTAY